MTVNIYLTFMLVHWTTFSLLIEQAISLLTLYVQVAYNIYPSVKMFVDRALDFELLVVIKKNKAKTFRTIFYFLFKFP